MRVLVTGSAGFVGKEMINLLKQNGHYVIGIDINQDKLSDEFYQHDLTIVFNKKLNFDVCVHLASSVGGILFNVEKADIITYNNLINKNVLNIMTENNCNHLVFFSSINVFETNNKFTHTKIDGLDQTSGYALSKAIGEIFFANWIENLVVIRPTNIFGKSQMRLHDKFGESHVIPDLQKKIEIAVDEIEVFGDGSQIRNFIHVKDVCDFVVKNMMLEGQHYCNLRSDILISIGDLAKELIRISGKPIKIKFLKEYMKYEQIRIINFAISEMGKLGFIPKINSIEEGLSI